MCISCLVGATLEAGCCTVLVFLAGDSTVYVPGNSVLVYCIVIGCGVGCITGNFRNLGIPTCEGVGILCISCLVGATLEAGCCTVLILLGGDVSINVPSDSVLLHGAVELGGVGSITGHSCDSGGPAGEGIGVLGSFRLAGATLEAGRCTILILLGGNVSIYVPSDGVDRFRVGHNFAPSLDVIIGIIRSAIPDQFTFIIVNFEVDFVKRQCSLAFNLYEITSVLCQFYRLARITYNP